MDYPLSVISPKAKIGKNVKIGPFVTISDDVEIGDGTEIMSGAVILDGARIGKNCFIATGAVIANVPQDLKFKGEKTTAVIGDGTRIREYVTVNRGTASKDTTIIGSNCLIMAYCHIAHDCVLGNNIIMSNACQIAGEVVIEDYATIGGGTLCHQFVRIGAHSMIQGGSRLPKDVPPYTIIGREPARYVGLNTIGLRRRGYSTETIHAIQDVYNCIYREGLNISQGVAAAETELPESPEKKIILDFIKSAHRGILN
jgi:UDP-N-acetylglucosamine acyltransferase